MTKPFIGIIGGSGLGEAIGQEPGEPRVVETPFGPPSSPIVLTTWEGISVAILQRHGPGHVFNPSAVPYRANIFALKKLGVTHIVASGATGSLREHIKPGDLVIPDQIIDKTYRRSNTFYDHAAVHIEFAQPFCPVMRTWLLQAAEKLQVLPGAGARNPGAEVRVHPQGTYVCMEGPAFSTATESLMHRSWGGDLIGMTTCPEAKLAREAEIAYALIAMPTDYDSWRSHDPNKPQQELLAEIIRNLQTATRNNMLLIKTALEDTSLLHDRPSPAHNALKLAIWSDKSKIDSAEVRRLHPLWGRYFESA